MKEIMQTYGSMIVATIIGITLLACFPAVKTNMGTAFAQEEILADSGANGSYDGYRNVAIPKIEIRDEFFSGGTEYRVGDMLCAVSDSQNLEDVKVYAIYDADNNDYSSYISADGKSLHFPGSGIYTMYVKIICKNGMEDHARISIPVNQNKPGGTV